MASQQKITPQWRGESAELDPHVPPPTSSVIKNQDIALKATNLIKWCCFFSLTKGGEKTLCQQWRVTKVKDCGRKWGEAKEQFTSDTRSTVIFPGSYCLYLDINDSRVWRVTWQKIEKRSDCRSLKRYSATIPKLPISPGIASSLNEPSQIGGRLIS